MMRLTRAVMMRSISQKILPRVSDLVQTMATPMVRASTRALMTLNSGGMSRRKTMSGRERRVSVLVAMERLGMMQ